MMLSATAVRSSEDFVITREYDDRSGFVRFEVTLAGALVYRGILADGFEDDDTPLMIAAYLDRYRARLASRGPALRLL